MDAKAIAGAVVVIVFTTLIGGYSRQALAYALLFSLTIYFLVCWRDFFGIGRWHLASTVLVATAAATTAVGIWRLVVFPAYWQPSARVWETSAVSVFPSEPFKLRDGQWVNTQTVTVVNTHPSMTAYSVWLEFTWDNASLGTAEMLLSGEVDKEAPKWSPVIRDSPSLDGWGLGARDDSGKEFLLINLYRLRPGQERILRFTTASAANTSASVKLLGYQRSPFAQSEKGAEAGIDFMVPKTINATGNYFMRDTK